MLECWLPSVGNINGLMLPVLVGAAVAGPFEDATTAYRSGATTPAIFRIYRSLADQGSAPAQTMVGLMYALAKAYHRTTWKREVVSARPRTRQREAQTDFGYSMYSRPEALRRISPKR